LTQQNRLAEAEIYRNRLEILDPGARLERPAVTPVATVPPATQPNHSSAIPDKPPPTLASMAAQFEKTPEKSPGLPPAPLPADGQPQPTIARGTSGTARDSDPFAEGNRETSAEGRKALEQADQEFARSAFPTACALYEQAQRQGERLSPECSERWAY